MNAKNTKKSLNHENAEANITCNFCDGDISRLGVAYLTHAIHTRYIATSIIVILSSGRLLHIQGAWMRAMNQMLEHRMLSFQFGASFLTRTCLTRTSWARPTSTRCQYGAQQFGAFFQFGACQFDARPFDAFSNGNRQHAAHVMPHITISTTNSS